MVRRRAGGHTVKTATETTATMKLGEERRRARMGRLPLFHELVDIVEARVEAAMLELGTPDFFMLHFMVTPALGRARSNV